MIGAVCVQRTLCEFELKLGAAAVTMSSLQSLREFISERLAAAAEEIFRHCEGTIVQYEEELCRQRRLLDIIWKPQLQLHQIVLPQHLVTEEKDLCNQQINFRAEQNDPEPPQIKEEPEEQELSQIKEEQEGFSIGQDEEQLDLKQDTLMEIPTNEENEPSEADLNNQQSFNVTAQDEETSHHEGNFKKASLSEKCKDSPKEKKLSSVKSDENSRMLSHRFVYMKTQSDERIYVCKDCRTGFHNLSQFRFHLRTHTEEKRFSCRECDKRFRKSCTLKSHMRTHTAYKPFTCKECNRSFSQTSVLKTHMRTHTGEKPFTCKECNRGFSKSSNLKRHMRIHT